MSRRRDSHGLHRSFVLRCNIPLLCYFRRVLLDAFPMPTLPSFLTYLSPTSTHLVILLTDGRSGVFFSTVCSSHLPHWAALTHPFLNKHWYRRCIDGVSHYYCHSVTPLHADPCAQLMLIHISVLLPLTQQRLLHTHLHSCIPPLIHYCLPSQVHSFALSLLLSFIIPCTTCLLACSLFIDSLGSHANMEWQLQFM
ncbi:hypothetical protein OG21DRAFT_1008826 [Imleria badia]|nr:hypothetical protein OG21DRAFT_1008826 [Imleria badia]